jgi:hypothetical protein
MSTEPTLPPWQFDAYLVRGGGNPGEPYTVAHCWVGPFAPPQAIARENARLIVRAVNAHAALVDACEAALEALTGPDGAGYQRDVAARLRAALALAKGETA